MPIDPGLIPALERELEHAKQVKPGGQLPRKDRIAAIEAEIALHRAVLDTPETAAPEKGDASNVPTDYESHDDEDAVAKAEAATEEAAKKSKKSPTKRAADGEDLETAAATEVTETA